MKAHNHGTGCHHTAPTTNARRTTPNTLRADPTRTTTLRRRLAAAMAARFRTLRGDVLRLVVAEDAFGLATTPRAGAGGGLAAVLGQTATGAKQGPTVNNRWRFETDASKVAAFRVWLKERVDAGVLEVSADNKETPWLEPYIESAYKKGAVRAYTDAHRGDIAADRSFDYIQGGKQQFLEQAFAAPEARAKIERLTTRAFSQLAGVTAQIDAELTRVLGDALAAGKGPRDVARQINKSISDIEGKRALRIARTELVHAHNEAQLDAFEIMNIDEVGVMAEWSTAGDDRVCPQCSPLEGVVLKVAEARGMIPRHPNCRCAWIPNVDADEAGKGQKKAPGAIKKAVDKSVKAEVTKAATTKEARDKSRWVGADLTKK